MSRERKPLSKSERKLFWISGSAITFLGAFTGIWQWINVTPQIDIPTPKMPEPNGYDFYLQAAQAHIADTKGVDAITDYSGRYSLVPAPRSPRQLRRMYPLAAKEAWLRRNAKALQLLRYGFRYQALRPQGRDEEIVFFQNSKARNLAYTLAVESRVKAEHGDWRSAIVSALDCIEFGYDTQRGGPMVSGLAGISVNAIGLREVRSVLPHLDAATARQAAVRMEYLYAGRFPYSKTMEEEKLCEQTFFVEMMNESSWRLNMMRLFDAPGEVTSPLDDPRMLIISKRELMENLTDIMDSHIANGQLPYAKRKPIPRARDNTTELVTAVFRNSHWNWTRMETGHVQMMTMLALQAFKLENNRYPEKLDELAPEYLKQIPVDPFGGGEPLRYRLQNQKYKLWSVGPDGIDNQGKPIVDATKREERARHLVTAQSKGDIVADVNFP